MRGIDLELDDVAGVGHEAVWAEFEGAVVADCDYVDHAGGGHLANGEGKEGGEREESALHFEIV